MLRILVIVLVLAVHAAGAADLQAGAGTARRPVLIGELTESWGPSISTAGVRDGLLELGYRENVDYFLGTRFTGGDVTALPAAAHELVQNGAEIILASGTNAAQAAKLATTRVPIVFTAVGDPVELGLVQSLARPGANITGVADLNLELAPKRLEIFKEVVPGLRRVLLAHDPLDAYTARVTWSYRQAAVRIGIELVQKIARGESEARAALAQVRKGDVDGILAPTYPAANIPGLSLEAALREHIPTMFPGGAFWTERGALMSYGPDWHETGRQAARLVHEILNGANPGEIPVERNSKVELSVNLKTATALGITIPASVLARADRVVD